MTRSRVSIDDGSLELLLDTICNTFGGIIFISFLVVLLLNSSSDSVAPSPVDQVERSKLIELDNERARLTRQLERVRRVVASGEEIQSDVISVDLAQNAARFRRAQEREARLVQAKSEAVGRANEAQESVNEVYAKAAEQRGDIEEAQRQLEQIKKKLAAEITKRTEDAKVPRISATLLLPTEFFLKEGRLYGPLALADGTLNVREFVEQETETATLIIPNPSGGVDATPGTPPAAGISERFARVDPNRSYVRVWIWNDSYASFADVIRPVLDRSNLKLQLIPLTKRDSIRFSSTGPPQEAQ